jgi:molecular chaperone GrpE (heat shock protein)
MRNDDRKAEYLQVLGLSGESSWEAIQGRIDPRIHRVLEVSRESESGTEVLAKGYRLGEWVLRPALVKVILAAESPSSA